MRAKILVIASLLLLFSGKALAADTTYWVSANTIGAGTSCAAPSHNTPRAAVITAQGVAKTTPADEASGHIINICAGTYVETNQINTNQNNLIGLTIQGVNASPVDAIIQGNATPTTVDVLVAQRGGIKVSNLEIQLGDNGLRLAGAGDRAVVTNVEVNTSDNDCMSIVADAVTMTDVTISGCGIRGIEAIVASTITMTGITVDNTTNEGVYMQNITGGTVSDLLITDSGTTLDALSLNNVSNLTFTTSSLTENIISGAGDHGIEIDNGSNNNTFLDFDILNTTDDGITLNNGDDNTFTRINIINDSLPSDIPSNDGIIINATSTGNEFTTIVVDNTVDECIQILGDSTIMTDVTLRNCGDFGIQAATAAGTALTLTNINSEISVADDGLFIDNYNGTSALGDVSVTDVTINSPVQGFTISDSDYVQATNITVTANNQALNLLRNTFLEITDFTLSSTLADGIQLNNVDNSRIAGLSAINRSSTNGVGNGNNDHAITIITGSDDNTFEFLDLIDTDDDAINIVASLNNTFNDIDISNPTEATPQDGIIITDTISTGNSFSDITVDNVDNDCFETFANNTTVTNAVFTNCGQDGLVVNLTAGTDLTLDDITVTDPVALGISIANLVAGTVSVSDITVTDATTGLLLSATSGGTYRDIDIQGSTIGMQLTNADSNDFDVTSFAANVFGATGAGNGIGISLINGSDSNTFNALSVVDNTGDGIVIDASLSNTITASQSNENGGDGIEISTTSASNIIDGNLFLGNTGNGANLSGSAANSFYANCLRNTTNITDGGGGVITYINVGSGNFWGSFPADGTGFSEDNATCTDAGYADGSDDEICDASHTLGGSNDTAPLQTCGAFFSPNLSFSKIVLTVADDINTLLGGSTPKAIPGATMMYTLSVTNLASSNLTGAAETATITDDFSSEITANSRLSWNTGTMMLTSPDAAGTIGLTDVADADAGEFLVDQLTARCGTLNVTESCTLTFSLDIQ